MQAKEANIVIDINDGVTKKINAIKRQSKQRPQKAALIADKPKATSRLSRAIGVRQMYYKRVYDKNYFVG